MNLSMINVPDYKPVENIKVYGLEDAIKRAKYPMSTNIDTLTSELTPGITKLAQSAKGEGHDNWLCGIVVQFDLTFTVKAWTEMERYHFADIISSQSTMHRIARFDIDTQYSRYVDQTMINRMHELIDNYNTTGDAEDYLTVLYSNPCGFKLTAGMTMNYRQLKTIYAQRKNHRLPEWRSFCRMIESLPLAEELIIGNE